MPFCSSSFMNTVFVPISSKVVHCVLRVMFACRESSKKICRTFDINGYFKVD